jgi:arsenate reductase
LINVLFVCIGNSCRSQMAEGFARRYGSDVLHASSAGVSPAPIVQLLTVEVMAQKNIDICEQYPKSVHDFDPNDFDLIVNMSGTGRMPVGMRAELLVWNIVDPIMQPEEVYLDVRDQIEQLVMQLILDLRRKFKPVSGTPSASPLVRTGPKTAPVVDAVKPAESSQRFGFGRVRRARD